MRNIDVHFNGKANFQQVQAELNGIAKQMAAIDTYAQHMATGKGAQLIDVGGYRKSVNLMKNMRREFVDAVSSTGQFNVEQRRAISLTDEMTGKITKTKASFSEMFANGRVGFRQMARDIADQQALLQRAQVMHWGTDSKGRMLADVVTPRDISMIDDYAGSVEQARRRTAAFGEMLRSGGTQMVNYGKNLQWTGRQISMAVTLPVVAFGAVSGKLAYDIDNQMGRIAKVYDTAASSGKAKAEELEKAESASMETAANAAKDYGIAASDTLDVISQLAAVGLKGAKLQSSANEVLRLATLGEMDHATALDATIAMQNIFKQSTQETAQAVNYMNTVENQTSLSMMDFSTAIPIAAKPVQAFGGDIRELGTLMVAMKSQGISAAQGANAIKSAVGRLAAPTKEASDIFKELTGVNYKQLMKQNEGDMIGMLQAIDKATRNLGRNEKIQVFDKLFGKYQLTRMTAMMDGLRGIGNEQSQVNSAFEAGADIQGNATKAAQELAQQQDRASMKIKRAWENLKVQLAELGEPFLEVGAKILNMTSTVFEFFNSLPDGAKKVTLLTAGFAAMVGPAIMALGIAKQFSGVFAIGLGTLMKWKAGLGVLTKEQIFNNKVRAASTGMWAKEANAMKLNAKSIAALQAATNSANQVAVNQAKADLERHNIAVRNKRDEIILEEMAQAEKRKSIALTQQQTAAAKAGSKFQLTNVSNLRLMSNNQYYNSEAKRFATVYERNALVESRAIDASTQQVIAKYKQAATAKQRAYAAEVGRFTQSAISVQKSSVAKMNTSTMATSFIGFGSGASSGSISKGSASASLKSAGLEAKKTSGFIGNMSSKMQGFGAFAMSATLPLALMAGSSNSTADNLAKWGLYLAIALPLLSEAGTVIKSINFSSIGTSIAAGFGSLTTKVGGATGAVGKLKAGATGLAGAMSGVVTKGGLIATAVGAVGIVGGIALKKLNDHLAESNERLEMLNNSAKKSAEVFKYEYKEPKFEFKMPTFDERSVQSLSKLEQIKEKYGSIIDEMSDMSESEKKRVAINIALDARRTGASATQAAKLARTLLESASSDILESQRLTASVPLALELEYSPNSFQFENITEGIIEGMKDSANVGVWEDVKNFFLPSNLDEMSDDAEQQAKDSAKDVADAFKQAPSAPAAFKFIEDLDKQMRAQMAEVVNGLSEETRDKLADLGFDLSNRGDILKALKYIEEHQSGGPNGPSINIDDGDIDKLRAAAVYQQKFAQEYGKNIGGNEEDLKGLISLESVLAAATDGRMRTRSAGEKEYAKLQADIIRAKATVFDKTDDIGKAEQLNALNAIRVSMGLKATGTLQDGLNKKVTVAYNETKKVADETRRAGEETDKVKSGWEGVVNQLGGVPEFADWFSQTAISSVTDSMSEISESASDSFDDAMQNSMDNLEAAQEARMDAFDARRDRGAQALDRQLEVYNRKREAGLDRLERKEEKYTRVRERGAKEIEKRIEQYTNERAKGLEKITQKIADLDNLQAKFDKKWERKEENLNERFDDRIDKLDLERSKLEERQRVIQRQIDVENKAEEQRQANFEREISRIQRLAEAANRNIDFNVALRSGDLDEAARIQNDAFASNQQNVLEAAASASQRRSDRKTGVLEDKSQTIDEKLSDIQRESDALERARKKAMEQFERIKRRQQVLLNEHIKKQRKLLQEERQAYKEETRLGLLRMRREKQAYNRETQLGLRALAREKKKYERMTELHQRYLERARDKYDKETEAQREALQKQQERARDAAQERWEVRKKYLDKEMDAILAFTPKSMKEARKQVRMIEDLYGKYGIRLEKSGAEWSKSIYDNLKQDLKAARHNMEAEAQWKRVGKRIANGVLSAFGINLGEYDKWRKKGKVPKGFKFENIGASGSTAGSGNNDFNTRHKGGPIGEGLSRYDSRAGYSGGLKSKEIMVRAEQGEYVHSRAAVNKYGTDFMQAVNKGTYNPTAPPSDRGAKHTGLPPGATEKSQAKLAKKMARGRGKRPVGGGSAMGAIGGSLGSLVGYAGASLGSLVGESAMYGGMRRMIVQSILSHLGLGAAKPGVYGDDGMFFDREQLRNAYTIAMVGERMGFGGRDIQIALMAAMVESALRNVHYGDRDSLGLFQQRASWGSVEERTTPEIAARLFFNALRAVPNRSSTPMGDVAQDVQVSAFPGRYAGYRDEARDIYAAMMAAGGGSYGGGLGGDEGSGGWHKPLKGIGAGSWINSHDIPVSYGTPAYAVNNGKIVESRMITSGGSPAGTANIVPGARSYGVTTVLRLPGGTEVRYGHGEAPYQKHTLPVGSSVKGGSHIFDTGLSGNTEGAHLHLDINGAYIAREWLGARVPGMKVGGKTLSDGLAQLHEKEIVLTEPLSASLENGIAKLEKTGGAQYNDNRTFEMDIHVDNAGEGFSEFNVKKLAKQVKKEFDYEASRAGRKRNV